MIEVGHWVRYNHPGDYTVGLVIEILGNVYKVQWNDGPTLLHYVGGVLIKV